MADVPLAAAQRSPRRAAWLDVALILLAAAAMLALPAPDAGGAVVAQLMVPLRMLLLVAAATLLLRWRGLAWADVGLRRTGSWGRTLLLVGGGYLALALCAGLLMAFVLPALGQPAQASAAAFASIEGQLWKYLSWLAIAWTSAAIGEELIFRGFLQSRLEAGFGPGRAGVVLALLVQAGVFGFAHGYQGIGGVLLTAAAGLVLGGVRLAARRGLIPSMLLHGLIDTVSLTAVYLGALSLAQGV